VARDERTDRQMYRQTNRVQQLMRLPRAGRTFYHVPTYSERKVCDRQTDRQTDKYHKTKYFCRWNVFEDTCRMNRCSFWFWFDVNLSTFDKDMREKQYLHFRPPLTLTFHLLIFELHHHSLAYGVTSLKNINILPGSEWTKGRPMWQTDRQTDK